MSHSHHDAPTCPFCPIPSRHHGTRSISSVVAWLPFAFELGALGGGQGRQGSLCACLPTCATTQPRAHRSSSVVLMLCYQCVVIDTPSQTGQPPWWVGRLLTVDRSVCTREPIPASISTISTTYLPLFSFPPALCGFGALCPSTITKNAILSD